MKPPVVSVIFSVYNGAAYLREAIVSILNQTYRDFEFIIVDDGSTDATPQILDEFIDSRIVRLRNERNLGLVTSLNKALAVAKGEIIARMDADDISTPDRFQKQLVYLEQHPKIGVLGTAMNQIDERGRSISALIPPLEHELILWQTLFGCAIFHATVMLRRSVIVAAGGYNVNFIHSEDLELWSRLFLRTRFANLHEVLYVRRLHRHSIISTQSASQQRNGIIIRQRLSAAILGYAVPIDLVAWLLRFDRPLTREERILALKVMSDLYDKITSIYADSNDIKEKLRTDLIRKITLVNQNRARFLFRRLIFDLSRILPTPSRYKLKVLLNKYLKSAIRNNVDRSGPTRVVFVMNNFVIGGVEKLLYDIIARLDKQKFSVAVVTIFGAGPLEAKFRELHIPIYFAAGRAPFYMRQWFYKILWVVAIPIVLARLIWWLWYFHPAVVVTSLYQADILGMFAGWLVGVEKRVLIHHDVYPIGPIKAWLKRKLGVGLATRVVAVSQTVKEFVVTYFCTAADRVEVIRNGINVGQFRGLSQPPGHPLLVLGMLGRLEPVKGPLIFVQALQILRTKFGLTPPSCLAGDGSLKSELINYAIQVKLSHLNLDGEVKDVPAWMNKIDLLVVPSMSEGFGLVILEGLAAGKIVVASDLPATRELITDGVNGYLFPVGDVMSLANILHRLITDSTLVNQIRQRIIQWRQQCLPQYDINQVVQRYEQLLLS